MEVLLTGVESCVRSGVFITTSGQLKRGLFYTTFHSILDKETLC